MTSELLALRSTLVEAVAAVGGSLLRGEAPPELRHVLPMLAECADDTSGEKTLDVLSEVFEAYDAILPPGLVTELAKLTNACHALGQASSFTRTPVRARTPRLAGYRLVRESPFLTLDARVRQLNRPLDAATFMAPLAALEDGEVFWLLPLDAQHRLSTPGPVVVTRGILNSALVHPREVFRVAIVVGAASVILVHNHPSGDPTPSADDRVVTSQLVGAGRLLDIPVLDHVIVAHDGRYVSFAEAGLL